MRKYCQNGFWLGVVCISLVFFIGCEGPANSNTLSLKESLNHFSKDFFETFPYRFVSDANDTFLNRGNLSSLILASGASIAMHNSDADKNIEANLENYDTFNGWRDETINILGGPGPHFAATGIWCVMSISKEDKVNEERAWTMLSALSLTGAVTASLKGVRDNDTPNGKRWAWPSGHTSSSFTVASVLDEFYGPKVGIPAYIGASAVAWRMMDTGDHWGSDVVFGATLGWVVGHTVAGKHKQLEIAGFQVLPCTVIGKGSAMGVNLVKRF